MGVEATELNREHPRSQIGRNQGGNSLELGGKRVSGPNLFVTIEMTQNRGHHLANTHKVTDGCRHRRLQFGL